MGLYVRRRRLGRRAADQTRRRARQDIQGVTTMAAKLDLLSVGKGMLLPPHVETLQKDFTIHYLPPSPAERAAFLAPLADKIRFMQTTGFNGADAGLIGMLPKLEI